MKYLSSFLFLIFVLRFHTRSFEFPIHLHTPQKDLSTWSHTNIYLLVPVPEDVLRGLGALLHHAGQVHRGSLLNEDARAAQDLGVRLCNENFYNLSKPSNSQLLQRFKDNISTFIINSVEIALPLLPLYCILNIFAKYFVAPTGAQ